MNILITGIHGFIGSNLVAALKAQHHIYGLDIVSPEKDGIVQTFAWNELKDIPVIDCMIHLAGKAHDTKNQTNAQVYFDINTGLTQRHRTQITQMGQMNTDFSKSNLISDYP